MTERKAASGTSLLNKRSEAARLSVPALCFVSPAIHYEWKVSQQNCLFSEPRSQLALRPEIRALVSLSWLDALLSSPLPCLPKRLSDESKNGNLATMSVTFWVVFFFSLSILMRCNTVEQLTVCHHASPSVFLSATTAIVACQQKMNLFQKPGLVVFWCSLMETDNLFTVWRRNCWCYK